MPRALGRYELLRPLARGGMAEVYLARRRAAGIEKWLVVKRMRPERTGDPRFLDLFVREARLSMSLVHQNIVPVFDFGRIDDQVFLAMERVEGKDLGSSLARSATHRVPPVLAAFIAAECCQALDYAHQRKGPDGVPLGIVHRDVTPRNVLLSWAGEVKLTDFGIAALAGESTARLLGTPHYMAPEQARSEPIDPRADVYAIGLVLREALCGVRARPGADRDAILEAARRGMLAPWPHLAAATPAPAGLALGSGDHGPADEAPPAALVAIIDRATAATAADRYLDARSMLEELDGFIVAQRAAHRAESPARQLAAWLASVWEGAREDADSDTAVDAEHLVSFLDDGAFDVIGAGTMRSMAATAADEPQAAPAPPPIAPPALAEAPAGLLRVSSSTSTVASGSFETIPAANDDDAPSNGAPSREPTPPRRAPPARPRRPLGALASLLAASLAIGAAVFVVSSRHHGGSTDPVTAPAVAPSTSAAPPSPAPPAPTYAAPTPASPPPTPVRPPPAPPKAPPPSKVTPSKTASPLAAPPPSRVPPPAPTRPAPTTDNPSAGSDSTMRATCRVRINLTPWAYYTTDEDPTRHETPGTISLAPGPHHLHVWNPELHVERDITINVPADRDTMNYSEPLQPSPPPDTRPPHAP